MIFKLELNNIFDLFYRNSGVYIGLVIGAVFIVVIIVIIAAKAKQSHVRNSHFSSRYQSE